MFEPMMLLLAFAGPGEATVSHLRMPMYGTLHHGKLYGLFQTKEPRAFLLNAIDLKKSGPEAQHTYGLLTRIPGLYQRYWIRNNRVWLNDASARVKSMSFDELALFDNKAKTSGWDAYLKKYTDTKEEPGTIGVPALANKPYRGDVFLRRIEGLTGVATVPTSEKTLTTFLLLTGKTEMEIWDTEARFDAKTMTWENVADEKNFQKIKSAFSEDFYVFIRKDTYFFVTESGKAFFAPARKPGDKTRAMQELWDDAKSPINAVIEDADRDKVWLFAQNKADPKRGYYFEMKPATNFETFDPTKLRQVNVEGRAKRLLEYLPLISPMEKKSRTAEMK